MQPNKDDKDSNDNISSTQTSETFINCSNGH